MKKNYYLYMKACLFSLLYVFLVGCASTIEVTPKIEKVENVNFRVNGKIVYEGNKEYLPRVLVENLNNPLFTFNYSYNVAYGRDNVPGAVPLFNPLTIVGVPIGENSLVVVGKLDVLKEQKTLKSYTATCVLDQYRSIFSEGSTFSEMRRRGLIAVRDNIEAQVCNDKDFYKAQNQ